MPAVATSSNLKPYSSTYSSSYTSKYCSPSTSSSALSSSRNTSYRALSLDRPSATLSSSSARPLSRLGTSSYTSSATTSSSSYESRFPSSLSSRYTVSSRPPRPTESKYQFESLLSRKERLTSAVGREGLTSPTSSYVRSSARYNNNSYDGKSGSRESSISRESVLGEGWRTTNRRERSSSRGSTLLGHEDVPLTSHHNQDSSDLSQDSGYNSWGRSSGGKFSPSSKYLPVEEEKPRLSITERKAALENSKRKSYIDFDSRPSISVPSVNDDDNGNRRGSGPTVRERTALLLDTNRNSCDKENEEDARSTSSVSSASSAGSAAAGRAKSVLSAKAIQRPFPRTGTVVNGSCDDSPEPARENGLPRILTSRSNSILAQHPYLEKKGSGLRNIGNTCFMNCIIQCLSYTKPLLEYVIEEKYLSEISTKSRMDGSIVKSFGKLLTEMWRERDTYVNPAPFKKCIATFAPRFMGYDQQDAQEFLRYLLDGLHEDLNRVVVKPKPSENDTESSLSDTQRADLSWKQYLKFDNSRIVDIFVGQLKSTLTCTVCNHPSVTFDPFWDLSVSLPPNLLTSESVNLTDCLALFTKEEVLDGDEKVECSRCKKLVRATKKLTIQRFPKILVLHLKRFGVDRYRGKLTQKVIYPLTELNLAPYSSPGATSSCGRAGVYNLYGVANHVGSLYRGHYTAACRHPYRGEWFEFDDTMVNKIDGTSDLVTSAAYVLFYELSGQPPKHSAR